MYIVICSEANDFYTTPRYHFLFTGVTGKSFPPPLQLRVPVLGLLTSYAHLYQVVGKCAELDDASTRSNAIIRVIMRGTDEAFYEE